MSTTPRCTEEGKFIEKKADKKQIINFIRGQLRRRQVENEVLLSAESGLGVTQGGVPDIRHTGEKLFPRFSKSRQGTPGNGDL